MLESDLEKKASLDVIGEFIDFVQRMVKEYSEIGELVNGSEVSPARVNYALAEYYRISMALCAEYENVKIDFFMSEKNYKKWYDEKFELAKTEVIAEYSSTKIKPSLTEFEVRLRTKFKEEYDLWKTSLIKKEATMRFILRMITNLERFDRMLVALSTNMRSEMKALTIENRANASVQTNTTNRIRREFPSKEDYLRNRVLRDSKLLSQESEGDFDEQNSEDILQSTD